MTVPPGTPPSGAPEPKKKGGTVGPVKTAQIWIKLSDVSNPPTNRDAKANTNVRIHGYAGYVDASGAWIANTPYTGSIEIWERGPDGIGNQIKTLTPTDGNFELMVTSDNAYPQRPYTGRAAKTTTSTAI